jgi:hypothetical protein
LRPGSPELYRERSRKILESAAEATTDEARASFVGWADNWHRLAEKAEHPGW